MTITVNGNVNLTANSTNITAPTNNIKGNVNIDGTLDVTGATTMKSTLDVTGLVTGQADVKAGGGSVGMLTHTHPGVFPGPSSTGTGQG